MNQAAPIREREGPASKETGPWAASTFVWGGQTGAASTSIRPTTAGRAQGSICRAGLAVQDHLEVLELLLAHEIIHPQEQVGAGQRRQLADIVLISLCGGGGRFLLVLGQFQIIHGPLDYRRRQSDTGTTGNTTTARSHAATDQEGTDSGGLRGHRLG